MAEVFHTKFEDLKQVESIDGLGDPIEITNNPTWKGIQNRIESFLKQKVDLERKSIDEELDGLRDDVKGEPVNLMKNIALIMRMVQNDNLMEYNFSSGYNINIKSVSPLVKGISPQILIYYLNDNEGARVATITSIDDGKTKKEFIDISSDLIDSTLSNFLNHLE